MTSRPRTLQTFTVLTGQYTCSFRNVFQQKVKHFFYKRSSFSSKKSKPFFFHTKIFCFTPPPKKSVFPQKFCPPEKNTKIILTKNVLFLEKKNTFPNILDGKKSIKLIPSINTVINSHCVHWPEHIPDYPPLYVSFGFSTNKYKSRILHHITSFEK